MFGQGIVEFDGRGIVGMTRTQRSDGSNSARAEFSKYNARSDRLARVMVREAAVDL